ncbi:PRC-barrel domain-containing protein [Microvirga makkahensis]|uniref:PRC-barrel domain-containing protein n=1 Tax=Microvirga makkahensis TaxID=1128670 RepID=A0A7X3SR19_9HYPH|nr:PRC-barrel domain-containing protein [Microvirga makkahensis]MXQ14087.1 hypothetical protein [Microvirga makkahensis]
MITKPILVPAATMAIFISVAAQSQPAPSSQEMTTDSTTRTSPLSSPSTALTVSSLKGMELVAANGEEIGTIEGILVSTPDRRPFALIERGGFLGLGAKEFAIPLENATVAGDQIAVTDVKAGQLDGVVEYDESDAAFRELDDIQPVILRQG